MHVCICMPFYIYIYTVQIWMDSKGIDVAGFGPSVLSSNLVLRHAVLRTPLRLQAADVPGKDKPRL